MDDTTPSRTEQDLAGSLRLTAQELADANRALAAIRQHLQLRLADLEQRRRRHLDDAAAHVEAGSYRLAAKMLQDAASAQEAHRELERLVAMTRPTPRPELYPGHQCEPWQLLEHADGGRYCGACGRVQA